MQMKDFPAESRRVRTADGVHVQIPAAPTDEFVKHDTDKLRMDLLQPRALEATAAVLSHGAKKYSASNWRKGAEWSRYYGALQRHLNAWWRGERKDPDSGLDHLAHAACCVMFLQSYELERLGTDDRPSISQSLAEHIREAFDKIRKTGPPPPFYRPGEGDRVAPLKPKPQAQLFRAAPSDVERAISVNARLAPAGNTRTLCFRYVSLTERVVYIAHTRAVPSDFGAYGFAVLQPGDTENYLTGLQIAVGQAFKNFTKGKLQGMTDLLSSAEEAIVAADTRKKTQAEDHLYFAWGQL